MCRPMTSLPVPLGRQHPAKLAAEPVEREAHDIQEIPMHAFGQHPAPRLEAVGARLVPGVGGQGLEVAGRRKGLGRKMG